MVRGRKEAAQNKKFCEYFHIACGKCECWKLFELHGDVHLIRPCICDGETRRCDFRKIIGGIK